MLYVITSQAHFTVPRCYFARNNDNCSDADGFVHYIILLYCTFGKSLFPLAIILYLAWLLVLFIALAVSADDYFCPSIEIISKVLRYLNVICTPNITLSL